MLVLSVSFNAVRLLPELRIQVPQLNDNVSHVPALDQAIAAFNHGQAPCDPGLAPIALGYPLFH